MEKGIYPTYYLHMEKEDGKRVSRSVIVNKENVQKLFFHLLTHCDSLVL